MSSSLTRAYTNKEFEMGQIAEAFKNCLVDIFSIDPDSVEFSIYSEIFDSGKERKCVKIEDLYKVFKFDDKCSSIFVSFDHNKFHNFIGFSVDSDRLTLYIEIELMVTGNKIIKKMEQDLNLTVDYSCFRN